MKVSELIATWTEEERGQFADLIAECLQREQRLNLIGENMRSNEKELAKAWIISSPGWPTSPRVSKPVMSISRRFICGWPSPRAQPENHSPALSSYRCANSLPPGRLFFSNTTAIIQRSVPILQRLSIPGKHHLPCLRSQGKLNRQDRWGWEYHRLLL